MEKLTIDDLDGMLAAYITHGMSRHVSHLDLRHAAAWIYTCARHLYVSLPVIIRELTATGDSFI